MDLAILAVQLLKSCQKLNFRINFKGLHEIQISEDAISAKVAGQRPLLHAHLF